MTLCHSFRIPGYSFQHSVCGNLKSGSEKKRGMYSHGPKAQAGKDLGLYCFQAVGNVLMTITMWFFSNDCQWQSKPCQPFRLVIKLCIGGKNSLILDVLCTFIWSGLGVRPLNWEYICVDISIPLVFSHCIYQHCSSADMSDMNSFINHTRVLS